MIESIIKDKNILGELGWWGSGQIGWTSKTKRKVFWTFMTVGHCDSSTTSIMKLDKYGAFLAVPGTVTGVHAAL